MMKKKIEMYDTNHQSPQYLFNLLQKNEARRRANVGRSPQPGGGGRGHPQAMEPNPPAAAGADHLAGAAESPQPLLLQQEPQRQNRALVRFRHHFLISLTAV